MTSRSGTQTAVLSLAIMAASVLLKGCSAYYARSLNLNFLCDPNDPSAYVTHVPWDCASYVICMNGQALATPCPAGKLYAGAVRNSKCEPAAQVDASRCQHQIWSYIKAICLANPTGVVHDAEHCGQYFDCTVTNDNTITNSNTGVLPNGNDDAAAAAAATVSGSGDGNANGGIRSSSTSSLVTRAPLGGGDRTGRQVELMEYLLECPYPYLFSVQTGSCQDYRTVSCDLREEPKAPCKLCEYLQYLQLYDCNGPDCATCKRRHPSCVGLHNGRQPVPLRSDVVMECQGERTVNIFLATPKNTVPLPGVSAIV
ncbi:chitin binding beak protein 1 [Plakobranchus ocellatus]|uniref:Chitin binding beak protein 1 n=1 Tax=Plakobranchus ocellatus TaxID=259542 RepID=A0AAV4AZH6_9GAST|nr:chitin binding beak protein 1 [Plakobranchus ocellatus]